MDKAPELRKRSAVKKSLICLLAFLLLCLGVLTSCGGSGDAGRTDNGSGQQQVSQDENENNGPGDAITEDGTYDSKDQVALYLHTYGKLPSNYMTKEEAKTLGWTGGSLEAYAPGRCIGGDYFGNYEGRLPEDDEYHECDIDTLGASSRGSKRIVYSDDGDIYYTGDHYNSFEKLYGELK